jgi:hypothetical protein
MRLQHIESRSNSIEGSYCSRHCPPAKLDGAVVLVAIVRVLLRIILIEVLGPVVIVFTLADQFVLAVGTVIVLVSVVARANKLAGERYSNERAFRIPPSRRESRAGRRISEATPESDPRSESLS